MALKALSTISKLNDLANKTKACFVWEVYTTAACLLPDAVTISTLHSLASSRCPTRVCVRISVRWQPEVGLAGPGAPLCALVLLSLCALRRPVSMTYFPEQFCKVLKDFSWSITPSPSDLVLSLKISKGTSSTLSILTYHGKRKIVCPSKLPHSFNCTPPFWCFLVGCIGR